MLSGLTTRGRCLLAAGIAAAVCAWLLNERDLLRVAVFVVAMPLLIIAFLALSKVRISAVRTLLPDRTPSGTESAVALDLWRTGALPSGDVLLEDGVPYALGARPRFVVEHLPQHRRVSLRYPIKPLMRGIQQIGPLRATITDPFGICEFNTELSGTSRLIVVPRTHPLHGMPFGAGLGADDDGPALRSAAAGELDALIRQYRHGDDLRRVHWPSTAHRDEIMVRVDQQPRHGSTTVLIDHRAAAHLGTGPTASIEWAVSFAASVCLHVRRRHRHVRLVTEHAKLVAELPADGTAIHDHCVLDALAVLQPAHQRDINLTHDPGAGSELIAVLGSVSASAVNELSRYRPRDARNLAVLLDTPAFDTGISAAAQRANAVEESASLLRAAGWSVVVAQPSHGIPQIWAELCAASRQHASPMGMP